MENLHYALQDWHKNKNRFVFNTFMNESTHGNMKALFFWTTLIHCLPTDEHKHTVIAYIWAILNYIQMDVKLFSCNHVH